MAIKLLVGIVCCVGMTAVTVGCSGDDDSPPAQKQSVISQPPAPDAPKQNDSAPADNATTAPKGEASGTNPNTKPPRPSAPAVSGDVNHDGVVNEADLEACCPEGANADCLLECLPPPPAQEENPDDVVGDDVDLEGCLNACAEDDRDCLLECLGQPPQAGN